jgi:hypothetical protein
MKRLGGRGVAGVYILPTMTETETKRDKFNILEHSGFELFTKPDTVCYIECDCDCDSRKFVGHLSDWDWFRGT